MSCRFAALTLDAHTPQRVADFWSTLLDRGLVEDRRGRLLPGTNTQVGLRVGESETDRHGPNAVHLHLTSASPAHQQEIVSLARRAGASHLDVGQLPEEGHIVLADPEGNEFCVIEPGNAFLAGCGPLGELACDGTRKVGLFWAEALGWPLVWDEDEETAIQSPLGGTKTAWGGPPVRTKTARNRQRFDLVAVGDLGAEVARLVSLGAEVLHELPDGGRELADPDGNEFSLSSG